MMRNRVKARNCPLTNALDKMTKDRGKYWFADSLPTWQPAHLGNGICKMKLDSTGQLDTHHVARIREDVNRFIITPGDEQENYIDASSGMMEAAGYDLSFVNFLYMPFDEKKSGFMQLVEQSCRLMGLQDTIKMANKRNERHWWNQALTSFGLFLFSANLPYPIGQTTKYSHREWVGNISTVNVWQHDNGTQFYPSPAHKDGTNKS